MMAATFAWLKNLVSPPVFADDEDKTRSARILNSILWVILPGWLLLLPALLSSRRPGLGGGIVGGMVLAVAAGLWLLRRGQVAVVMRLTPLLIWLMTLGMLIYTGGLSSPEVAGFIVVILVAGLLGDALSTALFSLLSIGAAVGLFALERAGLLPPPLMDEASAGEISFTIINLLISSGLVSVLLYNLNRAFARIRQNETKLVESNENLQSLMTSLEYVAEERTRSAEDARQEMEAANERLQEQIWQTSSLARLNERMSGEQDISTLSDTVLHELCQAVDAQVGALFLMEQGVFRLIGSYAFMHRKTAEPHFRLGEGLAGQAAFEQKVLVLHDVPVGYLAAHSGMLELTPRQVTAAPFSFDGHVLGVVELASMEEFSPSQITFLQRALESVGVAFGTAQARRRVDELLVQTQQQASQLQQREESLRAVNEELQAQAETLRTSQDKLRQQQAHLEAANVELEEKTDALQQQRTRLDRQNRELLAAQEELKRKAEELQGANRYKSEFLANMSHELRTPLNSLLILARMLADNEQGNLTEDQVKSTQVIYNSGADLLKLINDILDLSKVEAGRMEFYIERTSLAELVEGIRAQFDPIASERDVPLVISIDDGLPAEIETDPQRLRQVIRNLLANAFKFTERGQVTLRLSRPQPGPRLDGLGLEAGACIAFQVQDTGIGIPGDQLAIIFEAFQQADGSTNRKYGGTGLGLAIAREMVLRLGGFIDVSSEVGQGSLFTVVLPDEKKEGIPPLPPLEKEGILTSPGGLRGDTATPLAKGRAGRKARAAPPSEEALPVHAVKDDRKTLQPNERVLLIIDDDPNFASVVQDFAHQKGFKCLLAASGESGLELAARYHPQAIILDLQLPGMSGWEVLDVLKRDATLRHIPVHIMSVENETMQAFQRGVLGFLTKPVSPEELGEAFQEIESFISRRIKSLLLVEDDEGSRHSLIQLLAGSDLEIIEAASGKAALTLLQARPFDCVILDLSLPDISGFDLLEAIHQDERASKCPIIVYTGRSLTADENQRLLQYADSVIVKGVKSPERLLDETALFLHRVVANLPEEKQRVIQKLYGQEDILRGKKILVVDDDMRNSFALSRLLSDKGVQVEIAANGQKALEILELKPDFDLVLMDVMMPVLDGLETTRRIRQQAQFRKLPILALTAKAMKGDREKCLEAGANDYLSKPVDADRLFSMLRVWLYNR